MPSAKPPTLQQIAETAKASIWEGPLSSVEARWLMERAFEVERLHPDLEIIGGICLCRVYTN